MSGQDDHMELSFRDSGIGMPPADSKEAVISQAGGNKEENIEEHVTEKKGTKVSPEILYEIRYRNEDGENVYSRLLPRPAEAIEQPIGVEPPVMKVVDVRSTWLEADAPEFADSASSKDENTTTEITSDKEDTTSIKNDSSEEKVIKLPPYESQLGSYIEITSPAVLEALRCVVDYAPANDLGTRSVTIYWPYALLVHYDDALAEYQRRFENPTCTSIACSGKKASRHIDIVRKFVKDEVGASVEDERKRHARGMATFEMLWLLYKPGVDMLVDKDDIAEHQPYVMGALYYDVLNGSISSYNAQLWNMKANSRYIGPCYYSLPIAPFAGEMQITSFKVYPFEYRTKSKVWGEKEDAERYFVERGKIFYQLRKQGSWDFRGYTTTFPRRPVSVDYLRL